MLWRGILRQPNFPRMLLFLRTLSTRSTKSEKSRGNFGNWQAISAKHVVNRMHFVVKFKCYNS